MKRAVKTITALSGSLVLMTAAAGTASANYTGYADGAPGPADTWAATHPDFGKVMHSQRGSHVTHVYNHHSKHHSKT